MEPPPPPPPPPPPAEEADSSGMTVELSGSSATVVLDQPYKLTCSVTQAAHLEDTVIFYRPKSDEIFAAIVQAMDECSTRQPPPATYSVICGKSTAESASTVKNYTLEITKMTSTDLGEWECFLHDRDIYSNNLYLMVISKL